MSTKAYDEAEILRLDSAWNEAYVRRNREPLAQILADDFTGLTAWRAHHKGHSDDQSARSREVGIFHRTRRAGFRTLR